MHNYGCTLDPSAIMSAREAISNSGASAILQVTQPAYVCTYVRCFHLSLVGNEQELSHMCVASDYTEWEAARTLWLTDLCCWLGINYVSIARLDPIGDAERYQVLFEIPEEQDTAIAERTIRRLLANTNV